MAAVCRELTKLHEEIRKAPLSTLITHYETHPAKGEIVVLIEGVQSEANLSPQDLDFHLTQLLENHSLKEAVDLMSKAFKLPKREVYQRALTLHTKKESLS
jgi:Predicted methyltransferases